MWSRFVAMSLLKPPHGMAPSRYERIVNPYLDGSIGP